MASISPMASAPTLAQVRDYVLSMLEGLSSLAETVDDLQTRDRVREFADDLMTGWSPRAQALLRQEFGRLDQLAAGHAAEHPVAPTAAHGADLGQAAEPAAPPRPTPPGSGNDETPGEI